MNVSDKAAAATVALTHTHTLLWDTADLITAGFI